MVSKTRPLILQLDDHDVARDFLHYKQWSSDEVRKLKSVLDKDGMECDYKAFLSSLLDIYKNTKSNRKKRERDDESDHSFCHEEENDPQYELYLESLKEYGNSYMLEYEENGSRVVIKYGDSSSDEECDLESRRKLKSAMKQKDGPSSPMPHVENQGMASKQIRNNPKTKKEENAELSTKKTVPHSSYPRSKLALNGGSSLDEDCVLPKRTLRSATKQKNEHFNQMRDFFSDDSRSTPTTQRKKASGRSSRNKSKSEKERNIEPDYHFFLRNSRVVNNNLVLMEGGDAVVYGRRNGEGIQKKEERDYGSYSDVEIIDMANESGIQSEFRHKVINDLRKPFNAEECEKLWQDIVYHKPEVRHLELRGGREMSCPKQIDGKSYLDHYPDLKLKLDEVKDNLPKKLNLLRLFFLWLQHPGVSPPWLDKEYLALC